MLFKKLKSKKDVIKQMQAIEINKASRQIPKETGGAFNLNIMKKLKSVANKIVSLPTNAANKLLSLTEKTQL